MRGEQKVIKNNIDKNVGNGELMCLGESKRET